MHRISAFQALDQRLRLDNITRRLLDGGTLRRCIDEGSMTDLTSKPTMFDHASTRSADCDDDIRVGGQRGLAREALFFALALDGITSAAGIFAPLHRRTQGVDGWVLP